MAKAAKGIDRREVKDWFSGLTFETQQSVLDEFSKTFEGSKEQRIGALERELAKLRGAAQAAEPKAKKASAKGVKVPPKYIDKATGRTWAGRGVQPRWVVEYLKKRGNKIDDLLISK